MVHEAIDTINNFVSIVTRIYEKGADAGFSREEISQQIIRPIARQRGLNKDQVYYLTHRPEIQEKSKKQYEELKSKEKSRNIPSPSVGPGPQKEQVPEKPTPIPSGELEDHKDKVLPELEPEATPRTDKVPERSDDPETEIYSANADQNTSSQMSKALSLEQQVKQYKEKIKQLTEELKESDDIIQQFLQLLYAFRKWSHAQLGKNLREVAEEVMQKHPELRPKPKPKPKTSSRKADIERQKQQIVSELVDEQKRGKFVE
jgi:hypothetical protein